MSLVFIDGFDHYNTAQIPDKGWTGSSSIQPTSGRRGGGAFKSNAVNVQLFQSALTDKTEVLGFAVELTSVTTQPLASMIEAVSGKILEVAVTTAGEITLTNIVTSTVVATATSFPPIGVFFYLEIKVFRDPTAGFIEVRKDGVKILEIAGEDTTFDQDLISFSIGNLTNWQFDDLYFLDGIGTSNNDFLGDVRVDALFMTSDGSTTDFTPFTAGANFLMVDESPSDEDTTFLDSGTISAIDYQKTSQATLGTQVHGVQQILHHRKTDAGTVTMNLKTQKPAGSGVKTHFEDTSNDAYKFSLQMHNTDPDDSTVWDDTKINATEWGFSIVNITT